MTKRILIFIFFLLVMFPSMGQSGDKAVDQLEYFSNKEEELSKSYLAYMGEVAHGGRARKMEKRRLDVVNLIKATIREASRLKPFGGDASLRNAYLEYWNIALSVFTEDYSRIVNMEEVAEQSYDEMEAYLLAQEKASEKLESASEKVGVAFKAFAANHQVTLTEGKESKLSKKLRQASAVNTYYKKLFLIFFKASVQEEHAITALNAGDVNALEQRKNSLLKYTDEGLSKLDSIKPYNYDGSLVTALRKVLQFYKNEATVNLPVFSDYIIKQEEFEKLKKSYDAKPPGKKTQADVDAYNKVVNDYNKAVSAYNKSSADANTQRNSVMENWNKTKSRFMDSHMP